MTALSSVRPSLGSVATPSTPLTHADTRPPLARGHPQTRLLGLQLPEDPEALGHPGTPASLSDLVPGVSLTGDPGLTNGPDRKLGRRHTGRLAARNARTWSPGTPHPETGSEGKEGGTRDPWVSEGWVLLLRVLFFPENRDHRSLGPESEAGSARTWVPVRLPCAPFLGSSPPAPASPS